MTGPVGKRIVRPVRTLSPPIRKELELVTRLNDQLIDAIRYGRENEAVRCIEQGADVNAIDKFMRSPLMWAVIFGRCKVVEKLLQRGATKSVRDPLTHETLIAIASNPQVCMVSKSERERIIELLKS